MLRCLQESSLSNPVTIKLAITIIADSSLENFILLLVFPHFQAFLICSVLSTDSKKKKKASNASTIVKVFNQRFCHVSELLAFFIMMLYHLCILILLSFILKESLLYKSIRNAILFNILGKSHSHMQQLILFLSAHSKRSDFCSLNSLGSCQLPIMRVKLGPRVLNQIFSSIEEHTQTFSHITLFANSSEFLFLLSLSHENMIVSQSSRLGFRTEMAANNYFEFQQIEAKIQPAAFCKPVHLCSHQESYYYWFIGGDFISVSFFFFFFFIFFAHSTQSLPSLPSLVSEIQTIAGDSFK